MNAFASAARSRALSSVIKALVEGRKLGLSMQEMQDEIARDERRWRAELGERRAHHEGLLDLRRVAARPAAGAEGISALLSAIGGEAGRLEEDYGGAVRAAETYNSRLPAYETRAALPAPPPRLGELQRLAEVLQAGGSGVVRQPAFLSAYLRPPKPTAGPAVAPGAVAGAVARSLGIGGATAEGAGPVRPAAPIYTTVQARRIERGYAYLFRVRVRGGRSYVPWAEMSAEERQAAKRELQDAQRSLQARGVRPRGGL